MIDMSKEYFRIKVLDDDEEEIGYLRIAHGDYIYDPDEFRATIFTKEMVDSEFIQTYLKDHKYTFEQCTDEWIIRSRRCRCW